MKILGYSSFSLGECEVWPRAKLSSDVSGPTASMVFVHCCAAHQMTPRCLFDRPKFRATATFGGRNMGALRDSYGNTKSTGYTIDWFSHCTSVACEAYLASPFFTTSKPIEALTARGCPVNLLVRLCSITTPTALREVIKNPLVRVRYYTDRRFHAKLYIVGGSALVGSANLTDSGLMTTGRSTLSSICIEAEDLAGSEQ